MFLNWSWRKEMGTFAVSSSHRSTKTDASVWHFEKGEKKTKTYLFQNLVLADSVEEAKVKHLKRVSASNLTGRVLELENIEVSEIYKETAYRLTTFARQRQVKRNKSKGSHLKLVE